jgi:hypothetical protein
MAESTMIKAAVVTVMAIILIQEIIFIALLLFFEIR